MSALRAELVETGSDLVKAGRIEISAPAEKIFYLLANPHRHPDFDGSRTVQRSLSGPTRLYLGARFGMQMRIKIPYLITNTCVEFEENRLVAWRHFSHHVWRYELVELGPTRTQVTEYFDGRPARSQYWLKKINAYSNNQKAILKTLVRLKELVESEND